MRQTDEGKHPAALKRQRDALRKAVTGWALVIAGLAYAFVFQDPLGFVACAFGGGILSIDNALRALGK